MSGGGGGNDMGMLQYFMQQQEGNSTQARREEREEREATRVREEDERERRRSELAGLRDTARGQGRSSTQNYLRERGLDPNEHATGIDDFLNSIMTGIAPEDENPGSYFQNAGEKFWEQGTKATQTRAQRELDRIFNQNFESSRVPFDLDDPYLASIESEQRSEADRIIKNMLDRGVITATGYGAANEDLDRQAPGVRSMLNEIGTTTLAGGQQRLKDIANRARSSASTLDFGSQFDAQSYGSEADKAFNDFIQNLGTQIRSKAPKKLFNTAGLANIAGAAQGAGNTKFNPNAAAGIIEEDDDQEQQQENANTIF